MTTGYFARVEAGLVTDVRRVTAERIAENPDLYPGFWVEVLAMSEYPAVGWAWSEATGFLQPNDGIDMP